jgi:hypothetical protein
MPEIKGKEYTEEDLERDMFTINEVLDAMAQDHVAGHPDGNYLCPFCIV